VTKSIEDEDRENLTPQATKSSDAKIVPAKPGVDTADDLRALLSRAALSESQYREFSPPVRANQQIKVERVPEGRAPAAGESAPAGTGYVHAPPNPEAPSGMGIDEIVETRTPSINHSNGHGNAVQTKPQSTERARSNRKKSNSSLESRWSVLGRALSGETESSSGRLVHTLANSISLPFAFISSISGGTGATTILATLARCFAAGGERVLLAGSGPASLLPLYFGAANPGAGELQSFLLPDSHGRVDTINCGESERPTPASSRQFGESEKGNLVSAIRAAAARSDRLLLDAGALEAGDAEALRPAKQFALVPLVPDLGCVLGLLRLEEAFRPREAEGRPPAAIFYILNKFDNSLALHRDIQASLERLLGDRLVPITLRRSDSVAEALADGTTVIDYSPETGIAQDFLRLADWLRQYAPASPRERSA